jgi:hypothetical protein
VAVTAGATGPASAQTFTIGAPSGAPAGSVSAAATAGAPAGRDFATDVIGDPWDFDEASDYNLMYSLHPTDPYRSAWGSVSLPGGVFTGISSVTLPKISLQFEGIAGGFNLVTRNGVRYPIDANRYRRLSFRMRRSPTATVDYDLPGAMWFSATTRSASTSGMKLLVSRGYDPHAGRYDNQMPLDQQGAGWQVYKMDLDLANPLQAGLAWSGTMRGIELRLGDHQALVNAKIEVDWVRLTERGVATVDLNFSGFGGPVTVTARHAETGDVIQIYPDNGSNATTFADNSTFRWDYGFLPPGTWTITSSGRNGTRTQAFAIDAPPVVHVTEPDVSGGRDFARTVIGDAWDLTNADDVARYGRYYDMTGATFNENGLTATTLGPGGDAPGQGDAFVALVDEGVKKPNEKVIPADEYYRLSFTLEYLSGKELPGPIALGDDWGAVYRVIWRPHDYSASSAYSESMPIVMMDGGPQTFAFDLRTMTKTGPIEPSVEPHSPTLWTGNVGVLRIDVNEAKGVDRPFRLSNVKLAADDEPNGSGFFIVRWRARDATFSQQLTDGGAADATVTLYYDTDADPAGRTPIPGATGIAASQGSFAWNVASLAPGTYWVSLAITDAAGNTQSRVSTGPVRVRAGLLPATDTDGDGMSDAWEGRYGVSTPGADDDGDGVSNVDEYRYGTDPKLSNRWMLSEGATGIFTERLALANPNPEDASVTISYLREQGSPIVRDYTVAGYGRLTVDVNKVTDLGDAAVSAVVTTNAGGVLVERTMFWGDLHYGGHTGKAVAGPRTSWYLAEGHAGFFDTFVLLANANATSANATVDFLLESGAPIRRTYVLGPNSRTTIDTKQIPGLPGKAFSTTVTSDLPITVERAMYFSSPRRWWDGGHGAAAVEAPATNWFVAEGCTAATFDMYLLLANPGAQPATATVRFLRPNGDVLTRTYELAAQSRTTVWVDAITGLESTDVSASVSATRPIIVERAMYWGVGGWTEAHASAGITSTGTKWGLAEGEFGGSRSFDTYILLANPGSQSANVRITLLRAAGLPPLTMDVTVPGNSRVTNAAGQYQLGQGEKFGIVVESLNNVPIVVERAMYWQGGGEFFGGGTNETGIKLR